MLLLLKTVPVWVKAFPLRKIRIEVSIQNPATTLGNYRALLRTAVGNKPRDLRKVGVPVSAGIASNLIAKLASDAAAERGIAVTAYTAGAHGAADIEYVEDFARELIPNHKMRQLCQCEIESYIPRVITAFEARDLVQVET